MTSMNSDNAHDAVDTAAAAARQAAGEASERASDTASGASQKAADAIDSATQTAARSIDTVAEKSHTMTDSTTGMVANHPVRTMLVVAAVSAAAGFVAGTAARSRS